MEKYLYRLDEIGKVILRDLQRCGRGKSFAEILDEAGIQHDNARQVEVAISLEVLELIRSVTYQLPLKIYADLTPLGNSVANALQTKKKNKVRAMISNAQRRLHSDFDLSLNT